VVDNGKIVNPIAIEIGDRNGVGIGTHLVIHGGAERNVLSCRHDRAANQKSDDCRDSYAKL
jgi:hypothetical protein